MKLAEILQNTLSDLEVARVKGIEAQHAADMEKIRKERNDITDWLNHVGEKMKGHILAGKVPLHKIDDYNRQAWVREAFSGKAKHIDLWKKFVNDWTREGLEPVMHEAHDGVGIHSWINLTVKILPKRPRNANSFE